MAYVVKNTRNQIVATVNDGAVDNSTSLSMIGRNYVGYGLALNTNFMYLLENFTGNTAPSTPVTGQLWYDGNTNDLKIYNGAGFVQAIKQVANLAASGNLDVTGNANIGNANITGTVRAATANITGSANIGSTLDVVGNITAGNVTGTLLGGTLITASQPNITSVGTLTSLAVTNGITATTGNITTVNSGLMQNGNSNVTITANSAVSIAANGAVRMTLAANGATGFGTATPSYQIETTQAVKVGTYLGVGGNPTSTARILADQGADYTLGTNYAYYISGTGYSGGIALDATSMQIGQNSGSRALTFHSGASWAKRMTIDGASGNVGIANTAPTHTLSVTGTMNISGAANIGSTLDVTGNITSGNLATSVITANGTVFTQGATGAFVTRRRDTNADAYYIYSAAGELRLYDAAGAADRIILSAGGNLYPNANAAQQLGLTTNRWSNIWGVASSALYADLAEKYRSDADYEPGTVLEIGGEHEITVCNTPRSDKVFGCVSTDPAYLMNDIEKEGIWLPVVLTGRAPIRVAGTVNKGDRLVSAGNGAAMAAGTFGSSYQTEIGRALETKTTEEIATIEAYISTR